MPDSPVPGAASMALGSVVWDPSALILANFKEVLELVQGRAAEW
jgi:hypothetical protein